MNWSDSFQWIHSVRQSVARRRLTILTPMIVGAFSVACSTEVAKTVVRPLASRNPTSYDFDLSVEASRATALQAFAFEKQFSQPLFGNDTIFQVSDVDHPVFGEDLLRRPGNRNDLYLQTFHQTIWASPIYRGPNGGLPFLAEFHIHFSASMPGRTTVTVTAWRTELINGRVLSLGHDGLGWHTRYVPVDPTTIEEYMILRRLGEFVGITSMPKVILPPD